MAAACFPGWGSAVLKSREDGRPCPLTAEDLNAYVFIPLTVSDRKNVNRKKERTIQSSSLFVVTLGCTFIEPGLSVYCSGTTYRTICPRKSLGDKRKAHERSTSQPPH